MVRGAAGAGTIGEAGGLTDGAPWPVVVGAGLLAVVLGMVMAKASMPTITAAANTIEMMAPGLILEVPRFSYRGGL